MDKIFRQLIATENIYDQYMFNAYGAIRKKKMENSGQIFVQEENLIYRKMADIHE